MNKKWTVVLEITGRAEVEVEAETEKQAKKLACDGGTYIDFCELNVCGIKAERAYEREPDAMSDFSAFRNLTREERKLCEKAFENVWDWNKEDGLDDSEKFSAELGNQYEAETGRSCVWWTNEGDEINWRDTLPRDDDFHTNGDTEYYYGYAKKRIAEVVSGGANTLCKIADAIKNRGKVK